MMLKTYAVTDFTRIPMTPGYDDHNGTKWVWRP